MVKKNMVLCWLCQKISCLFVLTTELTHHLTHVHLQSHTHTEHNKRGAIGLFCDHLRNGSWQPDTANFEEGVGEEPTAIGSEALSLPCPETARLPPGKAGFVWLLPPRGGNQWCSPSPKPGPISDCTAGTRTHVRLGKLSVTSSSQMQCLHGWLLLHHLEKNSLVSLITHF